LKNKPLNLSDPPRRLPSISQVSPTFGLATQDELVLCAATKKVKIEEYQLALPAILHLVNR